MTANGPWFLRELKWRAFLLSSGIATGRKGVQNMQGVTEEKRKSSFQCASLPSTVTWKISCAHGIRDDLFFQMHVVNLHIKNMNDNLCILPFTTHITLKKQVRWQHGQSWFTLHPASTCHCEILFIDKYIYDKVYSILLCCIIYDKSLYSPLCVSRHNSFRNLKNPGCIFIPIPADVTVVSQDTGYSLKRNSDIFTLIM